MAGEFIKNEYLDRLIYLSTDVQIKQVVQNGSFTKYIKTTPGRILLNNSFV